jgi:hypothetical protein
VSNPWEHLEWGALAAALPLLLLTCCFALVSMASLTARRPATRQHCLRILDHLIRYVAALRNSR